MLPTSVGCLGPSRSRWTGQPVSRPCTPLPQISQGKGISEDQPGSARINEYGQVLAQRRLASVQSTGLIYTIEQDHDEMSRSMELAGCAGERRPGRQSTFWRWSDGKLVLWVSFPGRGRWRFFSVLSLFLRGRPCLVTLGGAMHPLHLTQRLTYYPCTIYTMYTSRQLPNTESTERAHSRSGYMGRRRSVSLRYHGSCCRLKVRPNKW